MSIPAPDQQTFHWIKGALDGSMQAVMSQVALAEEKGDYSQLTTVSGNLQQINGSLRMVELEAASLLAEDLEVLSARLVETSPAAPQEIAALRQGMEVLGSYVDAISRQTPVSPLGLVDQINIVREIIGRPSLSRFDLFNPSLSLLNAGKDEGSAEPRRTIPDDLRIRLVTQLRRKYRRALVHWLSNRGKGDLAIAGLEKIGSLLQHLTRVSSLDISQQLWWVADGFVDALAVGDLAPDQGVKSQFARLDFEISRLEDESLSAIAVDPPDQLLRQMLFSLGAIESAESSKVRDIQNTLGLTDWFDRDDSHYRRLLETSAALARLGDRYDAATFNELEQAVEIFFGEVEAGRPAEPKPVTDLIDALSEAVSSTGPDALLPLLDGIRKALRDASVKQKQLPNTQADIKIASALLFIRESAAAPNNIDATWLQSVDSHRQELSELSGDSDGDGERALRVRRVAQVEYQHARSAVAAQIREILVEVEKHLVTCSDERAEDSVAESDAESGDASGFASALQVTAGHAVTMSSVFGVADNALASEVAAELASHLGNFGRAAALPGTDNLEHLAFALAALGVAADHLSRRGPEADNVLRAALDRLDEVDSPQLADAENQDLGAEDVAELRDSSLNFGTTPGLDQVPEEDGLEPLGAAVVLSLIDTIDYQRRQLVDDNHDGVRGLMESFDSLAELDETDSAVEKLAAMGNAICLDLIDNEVGVSAEKQDFFGLLVRQLRDLTRDASEGEAVTDDDGVTSQDDAQADHGVDLDAWSNRVRDLTASRFDGASLLADGDAQAEPAYDEDFELDESAELHESANPEDPAESDNDFGDAGDEPIGPDHAELDSTTGAPSGLVQLDLDLRAIFVEEFRSHLHRLREGLNRYRQTQPASVEATAAISEMDDCVHTLSGNCRNLGFDEAADCAEAALFALSDDRSIDRTRRMASFAESLILLSRCRQQIKGAGSYDADTAAALIAYVKRVKDAGSAQEAVDQDAVYQDGIDQIDQRSDTVVSADEEVVPQAATTFAPVAVDTEDAVDDTTVAADSASDPSEGSGATTYDVDDDAAQEIDEEIRQIFIEESQSILGRINSHLMAWRADGPNTGTLSGIRREFHTLKGSAAATGFKEISALSHRVESLLEDQPLDQDQVDSEQNTRILDVLEEAHDSLAVHAGLVQSDAGSNLTAVDRKLDILLGIAPAEADLGSEQKLNAEPEPEPEPELEREANPEPEPEIEPVADSGSETEPESVPGSKLGTASKKKRKKKKKKKKKKKLQRKKKQQAVQEQTNEVDPQPPAVDTLPLEPEQQPDEHRSAARDDRQWMPDQDLKATESQTADDTAVGSMLRIGNSRLAELINASGEMGLVRTQLQDTLDATRMDLDVLHANMSSMRAGLRDLELEADAQIRARPEQQSVAVDDEFDPLQLDRYSRLQAKSREVTELLDQLAKVERDLGSRAANLDGALRQQLHLGDQLQSGLMSARMISMAEYLPRLRYLVRETSRQAEKPVEFTFAGGDIEVDRQVIELMVAPFEHMIRNAVAHGIEDSPERTEAGKSATGSIALTFVQQGSELVVTFADDGRGLDLERLGARAVELGLANSRDTVSEVELLQVITQPGYSTAESLTMEAGRGVGMDVVYQAVRDLGGSMSLSNHPGKGVSFQFRLPVTLAVTQALLIKAAGWRFAVRSRTIERLMRVARNDILEREGERAIIIDGVNVALFSIREKLGQPPQAEARAFLNVVLVRLADRLAAFEVDEFEDSVNIVAKTPGRQLASIPEISGVTVLGDATIVLILDPESFVDRIAPVSKAADSESGYVATGTLRRVLVVDDSLVVRKVMQKDLEADGMEVETAVDGINALEVLESAEVDVALVDIEMPRMNGYELLQKLRDDERYRMLPVIIITSRSGDQHRQRAMSLGADGYITKPYDIAALDALMREVVANKSKLH